MKRPPNIFSNLSQWRPAGDVRVSLSIRPDLGVVLELDSETAHWREVLTGRDFRTIPDLLEMVRYRWNHQSSDSQLTRDEMAEAYRQALRVLKVRVEEASALFSVL